MLPIWPNLVNTDSQRVDTQQSYAAGISVLTGESKYAASDLEDE